MRHDKLARVLLHALTSNPKFFSLKNAVDYRKTNYASKEKQLKLLVNK